MAERELLLDIPLEHEMNILGQMDQNLNKIQKQFQVSIIDRDGLLKIIGEEDAANKAKEVLLSLLKLSQKGTAINEQNVNYAISLTVKEGKGDALLHLDEDLLARTALGKPVKPKTLGQKAYVDAIRKNMITFGIGPAGTGKTYLAMAMAISAFREEEVSRIILTRPAIEAGEKLGFLPGDLQSKVDPYLRPLYDALYQIMGPEQYLANAEKGLIEVAPLAYMRGRTLDNAYIILDEAQNTTPAQMKMFLTRIGFGSKVVVTGDLTQKDLEEGKKSGLEDAIHVLKNVEGIAFSTLTSEDVVRHHLVQRIVNAYEKDEERKKKDKYANRHSMGSEGTNKSGLRKNHSGYRGGKS